MINNLLSSVTSQVTLPHLTLLLAAYLLSRILVYRIVLSRTNCGLPQVPTYLPLGIDFIVQAAYYGARGDGLAFWRWIFHRHGRGCHPYDAAVTLGSDRVVFTADPDNIKAVLATQFADYGKGPGFYHDWHEFLGDSIFATDGAMWQASRQLIRPFFIRERIGDLEVFETHTRKLLALCGNSGQEVDVMNLFFRFTLDVVTDFLLGASINSLDNPTERFAVAFAEVQRMQRIITISGPLKPLINKRSYREGLHTVNAFMEPYIMKTLALPLLELETLHKADKAYTFLSALALSTRDPKVIRDQLVAVLLAGRDTTAATLSWCLFELSANPGVVNRLRAEILRCLGAEASPSFSHLKDMKYLQAVMQETLRLYPAVPFNMRVALQDTSLPRGGGPDGHDSVPVHKDTIIAYSPLVLQRRPDVYPANYPDGDPFPDPESFVPERWLQSEPGQSASWVPRPWTYIPFNGGPRICLGQQFALTEMGYTLVRLFQKYHRVERKIPKEHCGVTRADIVMAPKNPVTMALFRPDSE